MRAATSQPVGLLLCVHILVLAGCQSGPEVRVCTADSAAVRPGQSVPILKVQPMEEEKSIAREWVVGAAQYPGAARGFAELVAHAAGRTEWGQVTPPMQVEEQLQEQGFEPTLQPGPEQLEGFVEALSPPLYLTAELHEWRMDYLLLLQTSSIEFTLTCHRPGREQPVWRARVRMSRRYVTDRELALQALEETFRRVIEQSRARPGEGGS